MQKQNKKKTHKQQWWCKIKTVQKRVQISQAIQKQASGRDQSQDKRLRGGK